MKNKILIVIILCVNNYIFPQNWTNHVIVRNDNNYVSYKDTISLREETPPYIKSKIELFVSNIELDTAYDIEYQQDNIIFKVSYSENIDLYIVKNCLFANINYYFFCYNKIDNKLSDKPYRINGKWVENEESGFLIKLLNTPLLVINNFADDKREIILKERVHNGNSYNAVISHYLEIDNKMNFKPLFFIEDTFLYVSPEKNIDDTYIIQRLYDNGKVNCGLSINNQDFVDIGSFKINYKLKKVKNKVVLNPNFYYYIVTGSGVKENLFLKKGIR